MNRHGTATVSLPSDCEILITRVFDAPHASSSTHGPSPSSSYVGGQARSRRSSCATSTCASKAHGAT